MAFRTPFEEALAGLERGPFLPLGALALLAILALLAPTWAVVDQVAGAVTTIVMIGKKAIVCGNDTEG